MVLLRVDGIVCAMVAQVMATEVFERVLWEAQSVVARVCITYMRRSLQRFASAGSRPGCIYPGP